MKLLQLSLFAVLLISTACEHKETKAEALERKAQELKAKNKRIKDSLDIEIIKLGGRP